MEAMETRFEKADCLVIRYVSNLTRGEARQELWDDIHRFLAPEQLYNPVRYRFPLKEREVYEEVIDRAGYARPAYGLLRENLIKGAKIEPISFTFPLVHAYVIFVKVVWASAQVNKIDLRVPEEFPDILGYALFLDRLLVVERWIKLSDMYHLAPTASEGVNNDRFLEESLDLRVDALDLFGQNVGHCFPPLDQADRTFSVVTTWRDHLLNSCQQCFRPLYRSWEIELPNEQEKLANNETDEGVSKRKMVTCITMPGNVTPLSEASGRPERYCGESCRRTAKQEQDRNSKRHARERERRHA